MLQKSRAHNIRALPSRLGLFSALVIVHILLICGQIGSTNSSLKQSVVVAWTYTATRVFSVKVCYIESDTVSLDLR